MVWPMIAAAAISLVGGAMQGRGAEKATNKQIAADKEIARLQAREGRKTSAYEMELMDYYAQLERQRNRDARASMYDKYSTIQKPEGFQRAALAGPKPANPDATGALGSPLPNQRAPYVVPTGPLAGGNTDVG